MMLVFVTFGGQSVKWKTPLGFPFFLFHHPSWCCFVFPLSSRCSRFLVCAAASPSNYRRWSLASKKSPLLAESQLVFLVQPIFKLSVFIEVSPLPTFHFKNTFFGHCVKEVSVLKNGGLIKVWYRAHGYNLILKYWKCSYLVVFKIVQYAKNSWHSWSLVLLFHQWVSFRQNVFLLVFFHLFLLQESIWKKMLRGWSLDVLDDDGRKLDVNDALWRRDSDTLDEFKWGREWECVCVRVLEDWERERERMYVS